MRKGLTVLSSARFLLNAGTSTSELAGMWLHLFDSSGRVLWSWEDDPASAKMWTPEPRFVVKDDSEHFWTVWGRGAYRMERHRVSDGSLTSTFVPDRSWFNLHLAETMRDPRGDPHLGSVRNSARIQDIQLRGRELWVLGSYGGDRGIEQVIDVFDTRRKVLLWTHHIQSRRNQYLSGFFEPDLLAQVGMTESGVRIQLLRGRFEPQ